MEIVRGLLGLCILIGIAFVFSKHKNKVNWKLVGSGVAIQIILGLLVFKVPAFAAGFGVVAGFFTQLLNFTDAGAQFIFGTWPDMAKILVSGSEGDVTHTIGYVFAFKVFTYGCFLLSSYIAIILFRHSTKNRFWICLDP